MNVIYGLLTKFVCIRLFREITALIFLRYHGLYAQIPIFFDPSDEIYFGNFNHYKIVFIF